MNFKRVAIIGTDCISVSIALGLKAQKEPPEIVGYDARKVTADLARARGSFDRVERKPERTCQDADLVIVAAPLLAVRETFAAIAPHLQPGCLVTDTARLKAPVLRWAEELLPRNVSFVGGRIILNPASAGIESLDDLDAASADLLKEALYCFAISPDQSEGTGAALGACSTLARLLGAQPFFIDVTEHDGLQAGVEDLPDLLTIALLRATIDTPGWQEMRKFAGQRFAAATETADKADDLHAAILLNRENVVHRLNVLLKELVRLRDWLTQDDAEALEEAFTAAAEGRARWIRERGQGMWAGEGFVGTDQVPGAGEQIGRMFFGNLPARLKRSERSRE